MEQLPPQDSEHQPIWDKLLRFANSKTIEELYSEIGQGKRITSLIAKHLAALMAEQGEKRNTILQSQQHFTREESEFGHIITIDGSEKSSIKFAQCCHPIPGDAIVGYLGRGEGLVVHTADCSVAKKLRVKDAERFIEVEWSEQMTCAFAVAITVTMHNRLGAIASITSTIATARADIGYIGTSDDMYQETIDLRLILQVRDRLHLANVLRAIHRLPVTIRAQRVRGSS